MLIPRNLADTRASSGRPCSRRAATEAGRGRPRPFPWDPGSRARPPPDRQSSAEGLATKKEKKKKHPNLLEAGEGGEKKRAEKGGGARGARARAECPDAALRQSEARHAGRGWGEATASRGLRAPHSRSPGRVPLTTAPDPSDRARGESPQAPRQRHRRSQTKWRHHPPLPSSRRFPPQRCGSPPSPATTGPAEKPQVWPGRDEASPGRAIASSRPHIPFEAMSAHARTGRQAAEFQATAKGRRED